VPYLVDIRVGNCNALGLAINIAGGAGLKTAVNLPLGRVGGLRGVVGLGRGLGSCTEGEDAGKEDGGDAHFGGLCVRLLDW